MLELDLRLFHGREDAAEAAMDLVNKARQMAETSNRLAFGFLVDAIGVTPAHTKNEAYFREALHYVCAQLLAHAGLPGQAAEHMAASGMTPGHGGISLFHDAVTDAVALAHAQQEAIARGIPAVLLASMPRSASAALTQTLAGILGAPLFRISLGPFPNSQLLDKWLQFFLRGGGVLHDHFGAAGPNIALLRAYGIRAVHVLVRDPRAAAASYAKHWTKIDPKGGDLEAFYEAQYIPWLREWLEAEKSGAIDVKWIRSSDVTASPESLRAVLAAVLGADVERFAAQIASATITDANFVTGDPEGWRAIASPELQARMWRLLPRETIDLLELRP